MVVLITWFSKASGGGERSTVELCNKLNASPDVTTVILLFAYSCPQVRQLVDMQLDPKVVRYLVRTPLPLWRLLAFLWVMYICATRRPSIVQVNFRAALSESLAAKLCCCPVVACLRIIPFHRKQLRQYRFVNHIVCVSHAVYRNLRALGWRKEASVIHNGVDVIAFRMNPSDVSSDANNYYVLGRLIHWKRPDWFIHAAAIVRARCPSSQFYIFGDGPMRDVLRTLINRYKLSSAVHLMGWVDPHNSIVKKCGIFVLPSYEEPFGRSLVEAALQGKVIVASRSGAVPELLREHDLQFSRDNLDDLAALMIKANANFEEYQKRTQQIQLRFAEQFNLDRLANDYLTLYRRVILENSLTFIDTVHKHF